MEKIIKITVIVPAYNIEKYIARCIESIINQTYHNLEIIVIDDGSKDDTGKIIDKYASKDSRIIPFHQKNAGLVAVRERGIAMATGQYIGFVDGDDEISRDMYERLINNALKYKADISQCGILYCFYNGKKKQMHGTGKLYEFNKEDGYHELMRGTLMEPSLCNKIYKKELLIESCLNKKIVNNEDFLRNSVIFSRVKKSIFEDFCGYYYWKRVGSVSNNENLEKIRRDIDEARKITMENASKEMWKYAFEGYVIGIIGSYNLMIGRKNKEAIELKKECRNELSNRKGDFLHLDKKLRFKAYGILYFRTLYDGAHMCRNILKRCLNNKKR